ncbi:hypothetical protein FZEAL_10150 [Fusarium zealandicum]|uniref:Uncharacterized protein n=1 Tax=Fusarium zealandicum TaxID=1053134 RepID=A0A8H4U504_9HYPO|nr:hypothetical protein FZEAL_10150 [Fusarium zealandicum]
MADSQPTSISVTLAIDPPKFTRRAESPPSISLTAIFHAAEPIAIFLWHSVFNPKLAKRRNFTCMDLTTGTALELETTKGPKRSESSSELGGTDDEYYCTLQPERPVTFTHKLIRSHALEGERAFVPGHTYRLKVRDDEEINWWRYGRKEDVLVPQGNPCRDKAPKTQVVHQLDWNQLLP